MRACVGRRFVKCVVLRKWLGSGRKTVRASSRMTHRSSPPAKLAVTPISDDGTVAKVGHPDSLWGWTGTPRLRDFARCVILLHVVPEIIEDTNEVAVKIGRHKLAQLPRFVLGLGDDLRLGRLPLCEEFVHLSLAVEVEPEEDRA
jgi:hypothetical protein